jgi:hypothetical protein
MFHDYFILNLVLLHSTPPMRVKTSSSLMHLAPIAPSSSLKHTCLNDVSNYKMINLQNTPRCSSLQITNHHMLFPYNTILRSHHRALSLNVLITTCVDPLLNRIDLKLCGPSNSYPYPPKHYKKKYEHYLHT